MNRRVTSHDVAAAAGVSRTTVSFVLNDVRTQSIPESTRTVVKAAALRLGYVPSAAARTLRSGSSRLVLCLAADWDPSALMDEGLSTLTRALRDKGYATVVAKYAETPDSLNILWATVTPAAIVAMFDIAPEIRERIATLRIPFVEAYFHSYAGRTTTDDIQVDAGRAQAEHLIAHGVRTLDYLAPRQVKEGEIRSDRLLGVTEVALERGLVAPRLIELDTDTPDSREPLRAVLAELDRDHGLACYNDLHALIALEEARAAGIDVPRDLRIIGVDDSPLCAIVAPALSSVRFDVDAHMHRVADRVGEALRISAEPGSESRLVQVMARESS